MTAPSLLANNTRTDDPAYALLRKYFRGEGTPGEVGDVARLVGDAIYLPGGWQVVRRSGRNRYILSLDIPISSSVSRNADHWRRRILQAAEETGAVVLPVAGGSFRRANINRRWRSLEVVEVNDDFESVFIFDKTRCYLSGYDTQEDPKLYFLCRLPHKVGSVAEAREALKPASVKAAEAAGIPVVRQGDIFAIESSIALLPRSCAEITTDKVTPIYGTAHTATKIAKLPNNIMLGKGSLMHRPRIVGQQRAADHSDRRLGSRTKWWWLTRNTVPIETPPSEERREANGNSDNQG